MGETNALVREDLVARVEALTRIAETARRAEAALRESAGRFRQRFECSPVSLWEEDHSALKAWLDRLVAGGVGDLRRYLEAHPDAVREAVTKIRVLAVNDATAALYRVGTAGGITDFFCEQTYAAFIDQLCAAAAGAREHRRKTVVKTTSGEAIEVVVHWAVAAGHEASHDRVLVAVTDLTGLRTVEAERDQLATALDHVPEVIGVIDPSGILQYVNAAFETVSGYTREESIGQPVMELVRSGRHPPEFFEEVLSALRRGELWRGRFVNRRKDGTFYTIGTTLAPLRDAGGQTSRFVAIGRDITAQLAIEERARRTQKHAGLGVMAGGIAHDFNNLLMGVLGNADITLSELGPDHPARDGLETIIELAMRGARLTNQMLAYAGQGRCSVEPVNLETLITSLGHALRAAISRKTELRYALRPDLPTMNADADQIRQVVMNLVLNAAEAIGDAGGLIRVSAGVTHVDRAELARCFIDDGLPEGLYVYLEVADTGPGMDEETLRRIFDPFFTTRFTGRGLGLASVLGTVRSHRGTLRAESTLGEGSRFRAYFPALGAAREGAGVPAQPSATTLSGVVLLVVDDDESVRRLARSVLERAGADVITAEHGDAALSRLETGDREVHGLLLDWHVPEVDGAAIVRRLRESWPTLPVLLTSGPGEPETAAALHADPHIAFLPKPYRVVELVRCFRDLLTP